MQHDVTLRRPDDAAASRVAVALAVAVLVALPFSAVDLGLPVGDMGGNLALPAFAALALVLLPAGLPFPLWAIDGDPFERLVVAIVRFFLWCALVTLATGVVFEYQGLDAYGLTPFAHSLPRAPIPLVLGAVVAVAWIVGARVLPPETADRVMLAMAALIAVWGVVQLLALSGAPDWYGPIARAIEGQRALAQGEAGFVDYVSWTGRLNLTTFEAAEAARLLLIVYLPVIVTPLDGRAPGPARLILAAAMAVFIVSAETIVGLAGLALFAAMMLPLLPGRIRFGLVALAPFAVVLVALMLPDSFAERLRAMTEIRDIGSFDQSVLTRAAFAVGSLDVLLAHPLTGIGWSKDIFFMIDVMPEWGMTWEVVRSLTTGEAVAAKSLVIRILLYGGVPAFGLLAFAYGRAAVAAYRRRAPGGDPVMVRGVLVLAMFAFCGLVDGGLLTAFYSFTALGLVLGQMSATMHGRW
jgi:hypothetical protein